MEAVASRIPKEGTEALKDQGSTDDDINRNGAARVSESPTVASDETQPTGSPNPKESIPDGSDGSKSGGNGGGFSDSKPKAPEVVKFTTNFTSSSYVFSVSSEPRDITYDADNGTVIFRDVKWEVLDGKEWFTLKRAIFQDENALQAEAEEPFGEVSYKRAQLDLADDSVASVLGLQMQIQIDWETPLADGWTKSDIFTVSNQNTAELQDTMKEANNNPENELESFTLKGSETSTSGATASPTEDSDSSGGGGGGLSTGATAGIAVGAVIGGLLIIGALVWFLLRRRRRSKQLGDDYTSQQAYAVDKETHGRATDSPNSPYSDENQVQPVALEGISRDRDDPSFNAHGTPPPPRTSIGSHGRGGNSGAQTPQGVSSRVAHLVEEGMTPEEIRRLEEEERQLDDEIERAARR